MVKGATLISPLTAVVLTLTLPCILLAAELEKPARTLADRENDCYKMVTLPTPTGVQFEAGGLQFVGDDELACSTRTGDIWIGKSDPGVTNRRPLRGPR